VVTDVAAVLLAADGVVVVEVMVVCGEKDVMMVARMIYRGCTLVAHQHAYTPTPYTYKSTELNPIVISPRKFKTIFLDSII
jgi:hypothetical protein